MADFAESVGGELGEQAELGFGEVDGCDEALLAGGSWGGEFLGEFEDGGGARFVLLAQAESGAGEVVVGDLAGLEWGGGGGEVGEKEAAFMLDSGVLVRGHFYIVA